MCEGFTGNSALTPSVRSRRRPARRRLRAPGRRPVTGVDGLPSKRRIRRSRALPAARESYTRALPIASAGAGISALFGQPNRQPILDARQQADIAVVRILPRRRPRPPLWCPAQAVGLAVMLLIGLVAHDPWALIGSVLVGAFLFTTWSLAPYSSLAFRLRQPGPEHFERHRLRAERLKAAPLIGPAFRFGDRVSGGMGGKLACEYEEWIREHSVETRTNPRSSRRTQADPFALARRAVAHRCRSRSDEGESRPLL